MSVPNQIHTPLMSMLMVVAGCNQSLDLTSSRTPATQESTEEPEPYRITAPAGALALVYRGADGVENALPFNVNETSSSVSIVLPKTDITYELQLVNNLGRSLTLFQLGGYQKTSAEDSPLLALAGNNCGGVTPAAGSTLPLASQTQPQTELASGSSCAIKIYGDISDQTQRGDLAWASATFFFWDSEPVGNPERAAHQKRVRITIQSPAERDIWHYCRLASDPISCVSHYSLINGVEQVPANYEHANQGGAHDLSTFFNLDFRIHASAFTRSVPLYRCFQNGFFYLSNSNAEHRCPTAHRRLLGHIYAYTPEVDFSNPDACGERSFRSSPDNNARRSLPVRLYQCASETNNEGGFTGPRISLNTVSCSSYPSQVQILGYVDRITADVDDPYCQVQDGVDAE